jgi:pimeloyl-ACP methyl ester carboxylesterase
MNSTTTRDIESVPSPSAEVGDSSRLGSGAAQSVTAVAAVVVFALLGGLLTPRGPITSGEATISLVLAFGVGLAVGTITRSRWWMLGAPVLYAVVFEVIRIGLDGPTVDAIRLSSTYGLIAFVVGRMAHGVFVLAPLAIGTGIGWGLRGRLGRPTWGRLGWFVLGVLAFSMAALVIALSRPASTAPIVGSDGEPLAGSIAELTTVEIGGHEQSVMIRGRTVDNPVMLYLAGGPGGTDIGAMRLDTSLESEFVVVTWDQRGTGKSYSALDPVGTLTLGQMVSDTIELTEHLIDRFGQDQVYLVGNSWGSLLGGLVISERPDLYAAYVGVGQMVDPRETDIMFWEDALAWAEGTGEEGLAETLIANGPPPYDDLLAYEAAVGSEHMWNDYPEFDPSNEMPAILFVPEYDLMDKINGFRGFLDTFSVLYPQLQDIDFRSQIGSLAVPTFLVTGEHEARGRASLAEEWFESLDAPEKQSVEFEGAGHRAHFDQPGRFAEFMRSVVLEPTS